MAFGYRKNPTSKTQKSEGYFSKYDDYLAAGAKPSFRLFSSSAQEDAEFDKLLPRQSQRCGSVHGTSQYPLQLYQYERWVRKQTNSLWGFYDRILDVSISLTLDVLS